jgi:hypothetical protein
VNEKKGISCSVNLYCRWITFEILRGMADISMGLSIFSAGMQVSSLPLIPSELKHLSPERSAYNNFAVYLVTTVNVDPDLVKQERKSSCALQKNLMKFFMQRENSFCTAAGMDRSRSWNMVN